MSSLIIVKDLEFCLGCGRIQSLCQDNLIKLVIFMFNFIFYMISMTDE